MIAGSFHYLCDNFVTHKYHKFMENKDIFTNLMCLYYTLVNLNRLPSSLFGADPNAFFQGGDEYFSIADLSYALPGGP